MKKRTITLCCALLACALAFSIVGSNYTVISTQYSITAKGLPEVFHDLKIAHISDFHNGDLGKRSSRLIQALKEAKPDLIFITGDIIDSYHPNEAVCRNLLSQLPQIAPTYYAPGNHEARLPKEYSMLKEYMKSLGISVLDGSSTFYEKDGQVIRITGILDPSFFNSDPDTGIKAALTDFPNDEIYTLLLAHRPELLSHYCSAGADLVFSGHAHGGQFRLPFLGALFAPGQGFFPDMADGVHTQDSTTIVISKGLGSSSIPFRFWNPPELVVVTLKAG